VPVVAAKLAVGDRFQADRLLARHGGADRVILVFTQLLGVDLAALEAGARIDEGLGTQQAADLVGTKRGTLKLELKFFAFMRLS
jgi:hypothetical protein